MNKSSLIRNGFLGSVFISTFFAHSALVQAITLAQWQTHDFVFTTKNVSKEPFDVDFYADFKNEDTGKTLHVPGFYNGENEYVARIALPEKGRWTYNVVASNDSNGKTGEVTVVASDKKGKVFVDPVTKTTFRYENGDIYTPSAWELDWLFYLDQDNNDLKQTKSIVSYLRSAGFNQVL
ncbi:DUF5060 domain-containing protein, partial [Shigella flexneri]